jgi:hypothetical protein
MNIYLIINYFNVTRDAIACFIPNPCSFNVFPPEKPACDIAIPNFSIGIPCPLSLIFIY